MKTIGIKLADGSFYPVLQENTVAEKKLDLTTANNNQKKVMVDLYRSAYCTMEDAEYVDSLQIDNLVAHPNGEPDITFTVSLDENNKLSAKIVDTETGNQSKTTITLVSRTQEERLITDEYDIKDSKEERSMDKKVSKTVTGGGLLAAAAAIRAKEAENDTTEVEFTPAGDMNFNDQTETETVETEEIEEPAESVEPAAPEVPEMPEPAVPETTETFDIPEDTVTDDTVIEEPAFEPVVEESKVDEPVMEEPAADITASDDISFDLPDFGTDEPAAEPEIEPVIESESENIDAAETIPDSFPETDSELPDINFDFPGDDSDQVSADETISDDLDLPDFPEDTITEMNEDPFALPDDPIEEDTSFDIDIPDTTDEPEMPDNFFDMDDEPAASSTAYEAPASGGISFTGLYDKETELGESSTYEEEDVKKKTKVPVIICVVCAIICIIATAFVLLIIPSKFNLLHKKTDKTEVVIETPEETPAPEPVTLPEPEPVPDPEPVPEAKEDEIVIVEKAEEVIPEQPPVVEEKPADITYKIKWGDTLWDIADTYYKNPWRYKYIARFNKIKNPDYIISGTYITIPAE